MPGFRWGTSMEVMTVLEIAGFACLPLNLLHCLWHGIDGRWTPVWPMSGRHGWLHWFLLLTPMAIGWMALLGHVGFPFSSGCSHAALALLNLSAILDRSCSARARAGEQTAAGAGS